MIDRFEILNLIYPPSENKLYADITWRDKASGELKMRRILSREGEQYKQAVSAALNARGVTTALREFVSYHDTIDFMIFLKKPNWFTVDGRVHKRAGDAPSGIKVLQDTIFEAIGIDDSACFFSGARKIYGKEAMCSVVLTRSPMEEDFCV